jgi:hypothetical protein
VLLVVVVIVAFVRAIRLLDAFHQPGDQALRLTFIAPAHSFE